MGPFFGTPSPASKKGEIRARIAEKLVGEVKAGNLKASIGRRKPEQVFNSMMLAKFARKQKAMFLLGQHPERDNQIWHLPTAPVLTGQEFVQMDTAISNTAPNFIKVNRIMLQPLGLFTKAIGETAELYFQYSLIIFSIQISSSKPFGVTPTTYAHGVQQLSQTLFKQV